MQYEASVIGQAMTVNGVIFAQGENIDVKKRSKLSALTFLACAWAIPAHAAEHEQECMSSISWRQ
jgi:hypothetical protein